MNYKDLIDKKRGIFDLDRALSDRDHAVDLDLFRASSVTPSRFSKIAAAGPEPFPTGDAAPKPAFGTSRLAKASQKAEKKNEFGKTKVTKIPEMEQWEPEAARGEHRDFAKLAP